MTDFNERLNRIAEARATGVEPERPKEPLKTKELPGLSAIHPDQPPFLLIPLGILVGAFAVLTGRVFNLAILGDGMQEGLFIPPTLGIGGFVLAMVICGIYERLCRGANEIRGAVTIGFVAMIFGEGFLVDAFPGIWTQIYQVDYLEFALGAVGDPEVTLLTDTELAASEGAAPVPAGIEQQAAK